MAKSTKNSQTFRQRRFRAKSGSLLMQRKATKRKSYIILYHQTGNKSTCGAVFTKL